MLRIGICDDIYNARIILKNSLEKILGDKQVTYYEFSSGEGFLSWMKKHIGEIDLLFLDIEMKELNGMETAKKLKEIDENVQIVFLTGFTDYVFDGYSVGALGYLIKPAKEKNLREILERAEGIICKEQNKIYICHMGETYYRIPMKKILYFSSDKRQVTCFTKDREYTYYDKLDNVEKEVGESFVRIHQRYLVKISAIERLENNELFLNDNIKLPISRSCRQNVLLAMAREELNEL